MCTTDKTWSNPEELELVMMHLYAGEKCPDFYRTCAICEEWKEYEKKGRLSVRQLRFFIEYLLEEEEFRNEVLNRRNK